MQALNIASVTADIVEDKYDIQPESGFLKRRQAVKKNVIVRGHKFQKAPRGISNRCVVCEKIMLTGLTCECA